MRFEITRKPDYLWPLAAWRLRMYDGDKMVDERRLLLGLFLRLRIKMKIKLMLHQWKRINAVIAEFNR